MADEPLHPELLERLRCPRSLQPLRWAEASQVEALNARISSGQARTLGGRPISEPITRALINDDSTLLYVVRRFPMLLPEDAISSQAPLA